MATASTHDRPVSPNRIVYQSALVGILAGAVFGVFIQFRLGRMGTIGALVTLGEPSVSVGWVAHVVNSAIFGALFGLAVDRDPVRDHALHPPSGLVVGAGYGVLLWTVNIVFLWPTLLGALGGIDAPSAPFLAVGPLVGHLVYGGLTGVFLSLVVGSR